jgi:hypothetical protein
MRRPFAARAASKPFALDRERFARFSREEISRHVVEVTAEGFQVLDTQTKALRADVWSTRKQAQAACEELDPSELARSGGSG